MTTLNLTPLKYLLFIENVTSVFRNFLCLKRRTRIFVIIWVLIETFNVSLNAVVNFAYDNETFTKTQRIYFFSSTLFSIYVMIASLYYSKKFYNLLLNFDSFYKIFDDEVYNQTMLRAQKKFTCSVVLFCCAEMFAYTSFRLYESTAEESLVASTLSQYNISVSDYRYIYQYFILYCIFFVISEQLKAITRSIDNELSEMKKNQNANAGNLPSETVNHNKLNKWLKTYENINDSCNLCNSMFSVQLTIMLLIVTVYYIILLYVIALITVAGVQSWSSLLMNVGNMAVFLMALFVISRAGQHIQNSSVQLRQKLCELCVHTLEDEEYYKLAKDFLRCVRTRPVRIHVFGTLNVNMSMLPSVVAFFTSYTVIALQFNNVV